jgi:hypothetical protein
MRLPAVTGCDLKDQDFSGPPWLVCKVLLPLLVMSGCAAFQWEVTKDEAGLLSLIQALRSLQSLPGALTSSAYPKASFSPSLRRLGHPVFPERDVSRF